MNTEVEQDCQLTCQDRIEVEHFQHKNKQTKLPCDRFIPHRHHHNAAWMSHRQELQGYQRLLTDSLMRSTCFKENNSRLLNYKRPQADESSFSEALYDMLSKKSDKVESSTTKSVSLVPERILDAPELRDDYYLNLMDWSPSGQLGIGLNNTVYLYTPAEISELCKLEQGYVCSISFQPHSQSVAIGNSLGNIQLYDVERRALVRTLRGHMNRVSSLSFSSLLFSGSKDTLIHAYDIKAPNPIVMRLEGHRGEVCGLKQSPSGLASGSNDNLAMVWDINMGRVRHVLAGHKAAVKAIAWCPWQRNLLATGGGTTDKSMRFWNVETGKCLHTINTESQVCSLIWNRNEREILSSHGYSNNQLCVWKYGEFSKIVELHGHTQRVLHLALAPDDSTVCSASADETLRFWKVFNNQKLSLHDEKKSPNRLNPTHCSLR